MPRRRQRANRSTAPTRNGTSSADQEQLTAQPRMIRSPAQMNAVVPWASSEPLVERADEVLGGAAHRVEPALDEQRAPIRERVRGTLAGGRQRDGGDAARDERPLLVEREGEGEVEELRAEARPRRAASRSVRARASPPSRRAPPPASAASRRRSRSAAARACDPSQVDDGDDMERQLLGEADGAERRRTRRRRSRGRRGCAPGGRARPRVCLPARSRVRARRAPRCRSRCRSPPARRRCCPGAP